MRADTHAGTCAHTQISTLPPADTDRSVALLTQLDGSQVSWSLANSALNYANTPLGQLVSLRGHMNHK